MWEMGSPLAAQNDWGFLKDINLPIFIATFTPLSEVPNSAISWVFLCFCSPSSFWSLLKLILEFDFPCSAKSVTVYSSAF